MKTLKPYLFIVLLAAAIMACRIGSGGSPTASPVASPTRLSSTDTPELPTVTPGPPTPEISITPSTPQPTPTSTLTSAPTSTSTPAPTSTITTVPTSTDTPLPTSTFTPAPTPTPDPNQGLGGILFQDQFDGSSGWYWGYSESGVVEFSLEGGSLVATSEGKNKGWRVSLGPDSFTAGDQQARLTVRSEACGDQDEWGLLFRGAFTSNSKFNGYVFLLNCAGQARVVRLGSSKSTPLLDWTPVPAAKAGAGNENTLLVWAGKSELRFYVNGSYVGSVTDSAYPDGQYGLYVNDKTNGNSQFRFVSLRVFEVIPPAP